jgi:protein-S-isoprenylcysteine O-methyltransferase Ste14
MMTDPYLVVRAGSLYVVVMLTLAIWIIRRRPSRMLLAGLLASLWNLPVLVALNLAAIYFGWWTFNASGGIFLGVPVDFLLAWAWLWGVVPALAFPKMPLGILVMAALAFDVVFMPVMTPVLQLGSEWLVGEAIGLAIGLIPGQLLARWTLHDEHLGGRATLQAIAFSGLMVCLLPASIIAGSKSSWVSPLARPGWQLSLIVQLLALPALVGLSAVQEFVTRGRGTPVPFDPPRRMVTTGVYAYVRNPMQLSAVVLLLLLGIALQNFWIAIAGVMAHIYSAGLAGWDEDQDLRGRFGADWDAYRRGVRSWVPRMRPWHRTDRSNARLYVAESCGMCSEVGRWFERRRVSGLTIVPAETHASGALTRITYEPADGTRPATGIEAVGRALEHLHLGWALIGSGLRLPLFCQFAQLLVDASGGEPRRLPYRATRLAQPSSSTTSRRRADSCR